jgi:hypothetical protein
LLHLHSLDFSAEYFLRHKNSPGFCYCSYEDDELDDSFIDCESIKLDLREIGWNEMDWIDLAQEKD